MQLSKLAIIKYLPIGFLDYKKGRKKKFFLLTGVEYILYFIVLGIYVGGSGVCMCVYVMFIYANRPILS